MKLQVVNESRDLQSWQWHDSSSLFGFNPRWSRDILDSIRNIPNEISFRGEGQLGGRLWLLTSGSQSHPKVIGLSKIGFLAAARLLGESYDFRQGETWLNPLPAFHVGGLAIHARAETFKQKVVTFIQWESRQFVSDLESHCVNWTSLVPTQIFDLVRLETRAPKSLRGIFVGGGALSVELYWRARHLGWPLLPTYGMTEASSQIATASLGSITPEQTLPVELPDLVLRHGLQVKNNLQGLLGIRGTGVVEMIGTWSGQGWQWTDPRDSEGFYWTKDHVQITTNKILKPLGRFDGVVKIKGELVSLNALQERVDQILSRLDRPHGLTLVLREQARDGYEVVLVVDQDWQSGVGSHADSEIKKIVLEFDQLSAPFERIREIRVIPRIPRSDLGKIQREELKKLLFLE